MDCISTTGFRCSHFLQQWRQVEERRGSGPYHPRRTTKTKQRWWRRISYGYQQRRNHFFTFRLLPMRSPPPFTGMGRHRLLPHPCRVVLASLFRSLWRIPLWSVTGPPPYMERGSRCPPRPIPPCQPPFLIRMSRRGWGKGERVGSLCRFRVHEKRRKGGEEVGCITMTMQWGTGRMQRIR